MIEEASFNFPGYWTQEEVSKRVRELRLLGWVFFSSHRLIAGSTCVGWRKRNGILPTKVKHSPR